MTIAVENVRFSSDKPRNAMSVDVEDYFHVSAFEAQLKGQDWSKFECRIPRNMERILELFDRHGTKATFFVLGWVAERYPELVRRVAEAGHEIGSHGLKHIRAYQQDRDEFRADARDSRLLLEDVAGVPVRGYRAASYSIGAKNIWALDVLKEVGYEYSSSIYPVKTDLYGMPEAPRFPFKMADGGILELPISTVELMGRKLPCGGGGYFRLYPYWFSKWAISRINAVERMPYIFYFHPWEIDPAQPRIEGARLKSRFRHYLNLHKMERRLTKLLEDFSWDRMDAVFLDGSVTA